MSDNMFISSRPIFFRALVALLVATGIASGCRLPGSSHPLLTSDQVVTYRAVVEGDEPLPADATVEVYTRQNMPDGFEYDRHAHKLKIAPHWPTTDRPHVVVGRISVTQKVDGSSDIAVLAKDGKLLGAREQAAIKEARAHGANAIFEAGQSNWLRNRNGGELRAGYVAVRMSDAEAMYPTVDELIGRLKLDPAFKIVQRQKVMLEELPDTTFTVNMVRGHCYSLGLIFRPGEIDRKRGQNPKVTSINFKTALERPLKIPGYNVIDATAGGFTSKTDNRSDGASWRQLDGVWSRAGAGTISCPTVHNNKGTITFFTALGSATKNPPPFNPGTGPAELIVFDRVLAPAEKTKKICGKCWHAAKRCNRKKLFKCEPLKECLPSVGMSVGACSAVFAPKD